MNFPQNHNYTETSTSLLDIPLYNTYVAIQSSEKWKSMVVTLNLSSMKSRFYIPSIFCQIIIRLMAVHFVKPTPQGAMEQNGAEIVHEK